METRPLSESELIDLLYTGVLLHAKLATPRRADRAEMERDRAVAARMLARRLAEYLAMCRVECRQRSGQSGYRVDRLMPGGELS